MFKTQAVVVLLILLSWFSRSRCNYLVSTSTQQKDCGKELRILQNNLKKTNKALAKLIITLLDAKGNFNKDNMVKSREDLLAENGVMSHQLFFNGRDGRDGRDGTPGIPGIPGKDGNQGKDGTNGTKGVPGVPGKDSMPGENGTAGAPGTPGTKGALGVNGVAGPPGASGQKGDPGFNGVPGLPGASGPKGAPGGNGVAGPPGASGQKGAPGVNGVAGPPGASGQKGDPGFNGIPGLPGASGPKGAPGVNGVAGPPGASGQKGTPGVNGVAGPPGASGRVGADGRLGEQGVPGRPAKSAGAVYTRFGQTNCADHSSLIYAGFTGGSRYDQTGGGVNYQCMPLTPEYNSYSSGGTYSFLSGAEYESYNYGLFSSQAYNKNVPCARCYTNTRPAVMMIPAKRTCPSGWIREYEV